jgi:hypothetical protein
MENEPPAAAHALTGSDTAVPSLIPPVLIQLVALQYTAVFALQETLSRSLCFIGRELLMTISGPGDAAKNLLISNENPFCHQKYPLTEITISSTVRKNGLFALTYPPIDEKNDDLSMC